MILDHPAVTQTMKEWARQCRASWGRSRAKNYREMAIKSIKPGVSSYNKNKETG